MHTLSLRIRKLQTVQFIAVDFQRMKLWRLKRFPAAATAVEVYKLLKSISKYAII